MSDPKFKASSSAIHLADHAYRHYLPRLHAFLSRRIHQNSDLPDLAMEVFERLLRARQADAIENPRAYLFRLASHAVGDLLRIEARSPVVYDSEVIDEVGQSLEFAAADDVAERIDRERQLRTLQQAIAALPAMHRAVLLLTVRDGLPHKEVAHRTGLTVATVGVYACEARARLRTILAQRQEE